MKITATFLEPIESIPQSITFESTATDPIIESTELINQVYNLVERLDDIEDDASWNNKISVMTYDNDEWLHPVLNELHSCDNIYRLYEFLEAISYRRTIEDFYDDLLDQSLIDDWIDFSDPYDFFNQYFNNPAEAARAIIFGGPIEWSAPYIRFDGYGNLETGYQWDVDQALADAEEDIINTWLHENV